MAFDNLKLEKGLYTTGKNFTQALESIDPSENYIGTEYEGLDAYQRQLKRFDIKVSGNDSDTISKFFNTTDSATLFPEYVSRAVKQGINDCDLTEKVIATVTNIDSMDYRSIEAVHDDENLELSYVAEGAQIPQSVIKTKDNLTKLKKRGRMLVASYEAIKFQKLDLFTITLKQIGSYIAKSQFKDLLAAIGAAQPEIINTSKEYGYDCLVDAWSTLNPYNLTTIIASNSIVAKLLKSPEFRDANAGLNFHGSGNMITPLGAQIVNSNIIDDLDLIIALDKNYAVEKVQAGNVITDFDKLIDRQLERATITSIAGFSCICNDAIKMIQKN